MKIEEKIHINQRIIMHLFFKSGNLSLGIDHFLVAFPSILLMAKLLNDNNFDKNSISWILLSVGICNIIFYIITNFKIPVFLGPSFAFVGFMSTAMTLGGNNVDSSRTTVFMGYIFSGVIFLFIAFIYKSLRIRKYVKLTLPDALVGPLISLIGLDLLKTAIDDSGFKNNDKQSIIIALFTLGVIIFCTVFKRKYLKNASILIGIVGGIIFACLFMNYSFNILGESNIITLPLPQIRGISFNKIPHKEYINIIIAVIPATIVVFSENITKITLLEELIISEKTFKNIDRTKFYTNSIFGHSIAFLISVIMGSAPNTVYAQNVALMGINNIISYNKKEIYPEKNINLEKYYYKFSFHPLMFAAIISVICSFLAFFQNILTIIPKAVYGGMELFVFAIISAQGVQLLVDRKVNYKKVTNQIVTSATLLAGLSGISIDLNVAQLEGLSLALLVGVSLNLFFKIFSYFGFINEKPNISDIIDICLTSLNKKNVIVDDFKLYEDQNIVITQGNDGIIILKIIPFIDGYTELINDYSQHVIKSEENNLEIIINENISIYMLKSICRRIALIEESSG